MSNFLKNIIAILTCMLYFTLTSALVVLVYEVCKPHKSVEHQNTDIMIDPRLCHAKIVPEIEYA